MGRKEIDKIVCAIMENDGPDGHNDGSEVITDFIVNLLAGKGEEWAKNYLERVSQL